MRGILIDLEEAVRQVYVPSRGPESAWSVGCTRGYYVDFDIIRNSSESKLETRKEAEKQV